jgi:catechol 2,3-dioxygenase-like lactoylglutathione lyase family enzyme
MLKDSHTFSGFSVNNAEAAVEFYRNNLGLEITDNGMGLDLKLRDGNPVFIYEKSDHVPATFTILNFVVDDIDAAVDELTANGVDFERYDNMPAQQDEKGILRGKAADQGPDIAWFKDPAGNILSVLSN